MVEVIKIFLPESGDEKVFFEPSSKKIPLSNHALSGWFNFLVPETGSPYFRVSHPSYEAGISQASLKRLGLVKQGKLIRLERAQDFLKLLPRLIPAPEDFLSFLSALDQARLLNRLLQSRALSLEMLEILVRGGFVSASTLPERLRAQIKTLQSDKIDYLISDHLWSKMVLELIRDTLRLLVLNRKSLPEFCAPWLTLAKRLRQLAWNSWLVFEGADYLLGLRFERRLPSWFGSLEFWAGFKSFVSAEAWSRLIGDFSKTNRAFLESQSTKEVDPTLTWLDTNWLRLIQAIGESEQHEPRWLLSRILDRLQRENLLTCLVAHLGIADTYRLTLEMPGLAQELKKALDPGLRVVCEGYSQNALKPEFELLAPQREKALLRAYQHGFLLLLLGGHFEL